MEPAADSIVRRIWAGWQSKLASLAAAALLFELVSGLAVTLGPFHSAVEWSLLTHTVVGVLTLAPLAWYFERHWRDYSSQALSDVQLLGYVGLAALAICALSGVVLTSRGLFATRTTPQLRYAHLISTLMTLAASVPHMFIAWLRRRGTEFARPAAGWLTVRRWRARCRYPRERRSSSLTPV